MTTEAEADDEEVGREGEELARLPDAPQVAVEEQEHHGHRDGNGQVAVEPACRSLGKALVRAAVPADVWTATVTV